MIKYNQRIYYTKKGSIMATLFSENLIILSIENNKELYTSFTYFIQKNYSTKYYFFDIIK